MILVPKWAPCAAAFMCKNTSESLSWDKSVAMSTFFCLVNFAKKPKGVWTFSKNRLFSLLKNLRASSFVHPKCIFLEPERCVRRASLMSCSWSHVLLLVLFSYFGTFLFTFTFSGGSYLYYRASPPAADCLRLIVPAPLGGLIFGDSCTQTLHSASLGFHFWWQLYKNNLFGLIFDDSCTKTLYLVSLEFHFW